MAPPLVTIVLPTYNGARYIHQSIQSCLEQTYQNWELIIVDDGSTDETPNIISTFALQDKRIQLVRHEINLKLPCALNTGFIQSRGEFLTWTSDDNLYRPHALQTMLSFLQENSQFGFVYTDYSIIDESGRVIREHRVKEPPFLVFGCVVGPCFLYRREVYEKIGDYAQDMYYVEDYDYWLRTARYFRMASFHSNQYFYREHANSLTAQKNTMIQARILQTKDKNIKHFTWVDSKIMAEAFMVMMNAAWSQRKVISAVLYLFSSIMRNPSILVRKIAKSIY